MCKVFYVFALHSPTVYHHHHHHYLLGLYLSEKPRIQFWVKCCILYHSMHLSSGSLQLNILKLLSYSCSFSSSSRSSYWWSPRQRARASWCTPRPSSSRDCRPPARVKNWCSSQKNISFSSILSFCQILFLWLFCNFPHQHSPFDLARTSFVVSLDSRSYHIVHDAWWQNMVKPLTQNMFSLKVHCKGHQNENSHQ